jgi:glucose-1-phosphate thymidylyltransferase
MVVEPGTNVVNKLGPIGALAFVISKREQSDLLVIGGDNLFGFQLDEFQRFAARQPGSSDAFFSRCLTEDTNEYGVGNFGQDSILTDFQEKSPLSTFKNVSTAYYFFRSADLTRAITSPTDKILTAWAVSLIG